jgi:hypothetical protein
LTPSSTARCHIEFLEHESGPEILAYLAAATAGLTLAKSVFDLITAIINAIERREKWATGLIHSN